MLKEKVRVAVMVSGGGTNLQALIDNERAGNIPDGQIVLVLSHNPTAYALERAKKAGIKSVCVSKADYPDLLEREKETMRVLEENGIELIVLAGYLSILSENFTKKYSDRIL